MSKGEGIPRALSQGRRKKRRLLTLFRICKYGISNFTRNAWLTVAATAVMVVTLLIVFTTGVALHILHDTVDVIKSRTSMSLYVVTETPDDAVSEIKSKLQDLPGVVKVVYVTPDEGRKKFAEQNVSDDKMLEALDVGTDKIPGVFQVNIEDINDPSQLQHFVDSDDTYKKYADSDHEPSFGGSRKTAIQTIGNVTKFAQKSGIVASAIFVIISSLIIFNTIRMAIFNRKEEIQMMKLIGADQGFIRGPFIIEAIMYGFIAAIVSTGLGVGALYAIKPKLEGYDVSITPTLHDLSLYSWAVVLGMIAIGATIGIVSSLLATRKYLKV